MTATTLTFGPDSLRAEHVSSRAGNLKQAAPDAANALTSMELIVRAKAGDELALNDLCARYLPRLHKWAHGRLPAYARGALDTHDIVQDTLSNVVRRLDSFEPRHDGAFKGFLHTALINRIRDQVRWAQRRPTAELPTDWADNNPSPFEHAVGREAVERYEAAMDRLRPADREAIIARIELGLPYTEVASALGKPTVAAAHVAVSRALLKLAREMSSDKRS